MKIDETTICPICRGYHFDEQDSYDICPVCGWEDDPLQRRKPDYQGGANSLSQNEYRNQWEQKQKNRL